MKLIILFISLLSASLCSSAVYRVMWGNDGLKISRPPWPLYTAGSLVQICQAALVTMLAKAEKTWYQSADKEPHEREAALRSCKYYQAMKQIGRLTKDAYEGLDTIWQKSIVDDRRITKGAIDIIDHVIAINESSIAALCIVNDAYPVKQCIKIIDCAKGETLETCREVLHNDPMKLLTCVGDKIIGINDDLLYIFNYKTGHQFTKPLKRRRFIGMFDASTLIFGRWRGIDKMDTERINIENGVTIDDVLQETATGDDISNMRFYQFQDTTLGISFNAKSWVDLKPHYQAREHNYTITDSVRNDDQTFLCLTPTQRLQSEHRHSPITVTDQLILVKGEEKHCLYKAEFSDTQLYNVRKIPDANRVIFLKKLSQESRPYELCALNIDNPDQLLSKNIEHNGVFLSRRLLPLRRGYVINTEPDGIDIWRFPLPLTQTLAGIDIHVHL